MLAYISEIGRRSRRLTHRVLEDEITPSTTIVLDIPKFPISNPRVITRERGDIPGCIKPERQDTFLESNNIKQWPKFLNGEYDTDYYIDQYVEVTQRYITQLPMTMGYDEYKRKRDNIGLIRPIS